MEGLCKLFVETYRGVFDMLVKEVRPHSFSKVDVVINHFWVGVGELHHKFIEYAHAVGQLDGYD